MDIDPLELVKTDDEADEEHEEEKQETQPASAETISLKKEKSKSKLNNYIAITIALTSTFMGICKVKDDNIVQAMQQAQANKIDDWAWYQARNVRQEVAEATVTQLQLQAAGSQSLANQPLYDKQIAFYQDLAKREEKKKEALKTTAENDQKQYDQLNFRDDQFDLSDASLSIAIAILAVTSLVQKRWLFGIALIPTALGVLMGLAGLFSWSIHPDPLTKLLSNNPPKHSKSVLATIK